MKTTLRRQFLKDRGSRDRERAGHAFHARMKSSYKDHLGTVARRCRCLSIFGRLADQERCYHRDISSFWSHR
jgi:hypothetical protein